MSNGPKWSQQHDATIANMTCCKINPSIQFSQSLTFPRGSIKSPFGKRTVSSLLQLFLAGGGFNGR